MGKTTIEWTDATWNPITGCTEISPGCAHCYAARLAGTRLKNSEAYKGLADKRHGEHRWTGDVRLNTDRLAEPLRWKKPRRIFVCDMADLFHEDVPDEFIDRVLAVMALCPQHTFQILTKRASRMATYFHYHSRDVRASLGIFRVPGISESDQHAAVAKIEDRLAQPLPNVWLGVSVENQHFADERIPLLMQTPAAVRFVSCEPLLGPVILDDVEVSPLLALRQRWLGDRGLDWVICGGESGPGARPMHPDWARSLRDQCQAAGVPFFFKQWGEWAGGNSFTGPVREIREIEGGIRVFRVGKEKAGRLLDGREWSEFPVVKP